jgi:hypothetical protein
MKHFFEVTDYIKTTVEQKELINTK